MVHRKKTQELHSPEASPRLEDVKTLFQSGQKREWHSGDYLIKEGSQEPKVFFILKGLIRVLKVKENGQEVTMTLLDENNIVASTDIILFNQPSEYFFQAHEDTVTLEMDFQKIQDTIAGSGTLEQINKKVLYGVLMSLIKRVQSFVLLSPEERYLAFIKENPRLVNRVPGKFIAHVLGITPVSLSRIRKRIATRGKG